MSVDLSLQLKGQVILHLSENVPLTEIIPGDRMFGMATPANVAWPVLRYGSAITSPYEASCWSGSRVRVTLHAFAETTQSLAGEDAAGEMASRIVEAMKSFAPSGGIRVVSCDWVGTRIISEDSEADRWHAIVEFMVIVVTSN